MACGDGDRPGLPGVVARLDVPDASDHVAASFLHQLHAGFQVTRRGTGVSVEAHQDFAGGGFDGPIEGGGNDPVGVLDEHDLVFRVHGLVELDDLACAVGGPSVGYDRFETVEWITLSADRIQQPVDGGLFVETRNQDG
jgi:hypothetical protein